MTLQEAITPEKVLIKTPNKSRDTRISFLSISRRGSDYALFSLFIDAFLVVVGIAVASLLKFFSLEAMNPIAFVLMTAITVAIIFTTMSVYDTNRRYQFWTELFQVTLALSVSMLSLAGLMSLSGLVVVPQGMALLFAVSFVGVTVWRLVAYALAYTRLVNQALRPRRTLIIGANTLGQRVMNMVKDEPLSSRIIIGFMDTNKNNGMPIIADLTENIFQVIEKYQIDEIILTLTPEQLKSAGKLQDYLSYVPINVQIAPHYLDLTLYHTNKVDDLPFVPYRKPAISNSERIIKRAIDITAASIGFMLVLPVFLFIALLIKLDSPGGVFFKQERIGENGKKFKIFKFRSMCENADAMVDQVKQVDENGNTIHKRPNDFRVTRIGKFIRKSSIDELPQLINVIRGDMSLVGPRPEITRIVDEEYAPWQYERFSVPQGITGWWQVNGRSDNPCHLSTDKDIYYIKNYSVWLDIKILLMTLPALLKGKGAY